MLRRFAVDHVKPHLSEQTWQKLRRAGGAGSPQRVAKAAAAPAAKPVSPTPAAPAKPKELSRAEMIDAIGRVSQEGLGANSDLPKGVKWVSPDPHEPTPGAGATRHTFLETLHQLVQPHHYFEIGIDRGQSMTLSRCKSIGVDPGFRIDRTIQCDVHIFRETSDDFFKLEGNFDHFNGNPVDLAFIDGMHLAEFVVRDFMNIEKHMAPGGVVVLDDMIPRNSLEAFRIRRTSGWTGDVYKVHEVLKKYRPDLTLIPVHTSPTGSYVIVGCDPTNTVLDEAYAEIEPTLTTPDPQVVDKSWLDRSSAYQAKALLSSPAWAKLRALRESDAPREAYADIWRELAASPKA